MQHFSDIRQDLPVVISELFFVDPDHITLPPKPGELPFRKMSCVAFQDIYRFFQRGLPIQIIQYLLKVTAAMQECRVSEACLLGTTGYGYNDLGRDTLEQVYAALFISGRMSLMKRISSPIRVTESVGLV